MVERPTASGSGRLILDTLPLQVALLWVLFETLVSIASRIALKNPLSPWEGGLLVEGVRALQGLPVYESAEKGHATSMYGPLMPYALAGAYRLFGVDIVVGRVLNLASMLILVFVSALVLSKRRPWALCAGLILLAGAQNRAQAFSVETRPDMIAFMCGGLGLMLCFQGYRTRSLGIYAVGTLSVVLGFLFKQTAAMLALVPLLAIATERRGSRDRRLAWAIAPAAAVLACVGLIYALWPDVFHYVIWLPRQYSVRADLYLPYLFGMIASCVLFVFAFLDWLLQGGEGYDNDGGRWMLCTLAVVPPISALAVAKVGGAANSVYPALLVMLGFCLHRHEAIAARLRGLGSAKRLGASLCLGAMVLASTVRIDYIYWQGLYVRKAPPPFVSRFGRLRMGGGDDYLRTIEFLRHLPGRIVSLDDPTIPYFAKGTLGRSMAFEMDNMPVDGKYRATVPDHVAAELEDADWVVSVPTWSPYGQTAGVLNLRGRFRKVPSFGYYAVFQRVRP